MVLDPPEMQRADKRVVHITTVHHPQDPRIFHKELCTLTEAGYDAYLIAQNDTAEEWEDLSLLPLPEGTGKGHRLLIQWEAYREAVALEADCYHIHDPELIPLARLLQRQTEGRVIYDMHENYWWHGPILGRMIRMLERWCFRWVDHVVIAERSYEAILSQEDVPYTFVGNYYKSRESRPYPSKASDFKPPWQMLYTGSIADRRGLSTMLDLAENLRAGDTGDSLCLVGICRRMRQRQRAEQRILTHDLGDVLDRVGWTEYVPAPDMVPYYRRADVGLALCEPHPNLTGSLLTKFYEYLHHGLPIICSDFPLWRDFIEENECGAVVPPGDAGAVLEVLTRWREHPEVYQDYVQKARMAASKYRWKEMGDRLVQVYRNLLTEQSR